ncbi:tape measure protein [Bacillus sp. JJ1562]|uniref:tape measure protein n=1 Tax=Bacillus sp. JJ1562 TaxID=3122960 RepID=UPI0030014763
MADGKVVIDVNLDSKDAEKSADRLGKKLDGAFQDKNGRWRAANGRFLTMKEKADLLGTSVGGVGEKGARAAIGIGKIVTALGLVALGAKAINMVTSALDGAISRYDTLNTFPLVLQQIGFSSEDAQKAIIRLSDGIQGLPTTLDDVAGTAQRIAVMTSDLNGAVDTTLALNNAFISSGSNSMDASRGLQQYVQMLSRGEVDLESWRTLQETMGVALNDTAKAFGFAGASAQNDLYDALKEGDITFDQFNKKLIELSNTQNGFADRARTSSGGIKTAYTNMRTAVVRGVTAIIESIDGVLKDTSFKSIENIIMNVGKRFNEVLLNIAEMIPVAVEKGKELWTTIKDIYQALEPWLPLIVSVVAGIIAFNTTIAVINSVKTAITAVKATWAALNATILANPIALVVAAIIAAAILIFVYWEPIKEFFIKLWDQIKIAGLAIWVALKTAWQSTVQWFKDIWSSTKAFFVSLWNDTVEGFKKIWNPISDFFLRIWSTVLTVFTAYWNLIKEYVSLVLTTIKEVFSTWWEIVKTLFAAGFLTLVYLVTGQWDKISEVWSAAITKVMGLIKFMWQYIVSIWTRFGDEVKQLVMTFVSNNLEKWQELRSKIIERVSEIITTVVKFFSELPGKVATHLGKMISNAMAKWNELKANATSKTAEIITSIVSFFAQLPSKVAAKLVELASTIRTKFNSIKSDMKKIGIDLILGLISGVTGMAKDLANKVVSTISDAVDKAKSFLGIKSPSRLMRDLFGRNMMLGYQVGIDKEKASTIRKMEEATGWMTPETPKVGGFINRLRGVTAPVRNVMPISVVTGSSNKSVPSQNSGSGNLDNLVGAINRLASRPVSIAINGREIVYATVDDMQETMDIKKVIESLF